MWSVDVSKKRKLLLWASMKGGIELFFLNNWRVLQVWISNNGRSWEIHFFICKALSGFWGTWHLRSGKRAVWKVLSNASVYVLDTCTHKYWNAIYFLGNFSRWTCVLHIICPKLVCLHCVLMSYSILVLLSNRIWQSSNDPRSHPLELSVLCGYLKTWSGLRISPCMWGM